MADPIKIPEVVQKADDLLKACQNFLALGSITDATLPNAKAVGTNLAALAEYFKNASWDTLRSKAKDLASADKVDKAKTAADKVRELISLEAEEPTSLEPAKAEQASELRTLFSNVSNSLINAQKELNKSSLEYVGSLDPRLPPTLYGIPNVKAEMRVGFNKIEGKGINLFLFTKSSQKQEFAESVVSFEIMGTAPPPGPAVFGDYVVPIPRLLVVGPTREKLIAQILKEKKVEGKTYENTRDKALVLRYEQGEEESFNRYLVLWVSQRADQSGPQWHGLSVLYAIGRQGNEGDEIFEFPNDDKDNTIFEFPPPDRVLKLPPDKLEDLGAKVPEFPPAKPTDPKDKPEIKLAKLSIDLGDVIMNLSEIVNGWLDSVKYKPPQ
jgi:hypothetical protein